MDCYIAVFRNNPVGTDWIVKALTEEGVRVHMPATPDDIGFISWDTAKDMSLEIMRFKSHYDFNYKTARSFIVAHYTMSEPILLARDRTQQFWFNRSRIVRADRMRALRVLVEKRIEDSRFAATPVSLLSIIYSLRAFFHPKKNEMLAYCDLVMASLKESGDVELRAGMYHVTPKALVTLTAYDEEERRHRDNVIQQRWIKIFTFFLTLAAAIEAWEIARKWNWIAHWSWRSVWRW